jgi:hypothetical protein
LLKEIESCLVVKLLLLLRRRESLSGAVARRRPLPGIIISQGCRAAVAALSERTNK